MDNCSLTKVKLVRLRLKTMAKKSPKTQMLGLWHWQRALRTTRSTFAELSHARIMLNIDGTN